MYNVVCQPNFIREETGAQRGIAQAHIAEREQSRDSKPHSLSLYRGNGFIGRKRARVYTNEDQQSFSVVRSGKSGARTQDQTLTAMNKIETST